MEEKSIKVLRNDLSVREFDYKDEILSSNLRNAIKKF
jgi:hypothetical protein